MGPSARVRSFIFVGCGQIVKDLPGEINGTSNGGSCFRGDRRFPQHHPCGCSSFKRGGISVAMERGEMVSLDQDA